MKSFHTEHNHVLLLAVIAIALGVTISMTQPNVSDVATVVDDSTPFPENTRGEALKSDSQNHVGVGWGEPDADQNIEGICTLHICTKLY